MNATISERLDSNLQGLTLASYLREPTKIISKAVGLFNLDPITAEEGKGVSSVGVGGDEGAVSEDSEVFDVEEGDSEEQKQEGWCVSKPSGIIIWAFLLIQHHISSRWLLMAWSLGYSISWQPGTGLP